MGGPEPRICVLWSTPSFICYAPVASGDCCRASFPHGGTVYHYFRSWDDAGVWVQVGRALYEQARVAAGRAPCPSVVIMDGQSVKTTERGGVDTLGIPIACRVEPADMSDSRAGTRLLRGLSSRFPRIHTVFADAGHESRKLARDLLRWNGWKLKVVKRQQRAFKITGLTWVAERSFAWLGRNRRLSKDYEFRVQTAELMIDLAATRLMLNRLASK